MAATAAVSPSDYLQPAAAATQASAQWALRAGARGWRSSEVETPRKIYLSSFSELRHNHLAKVSKLCRESSIKLGIPEARLLVSPCCTCVST